MLKHVLDQFIEYPIIPAVNTLLVDCFNGYACRSQMGLDNLGYIIQLANICIILFI